MAAYAPATAFNKQDEAFLANVASYRQHLLSIISDRKAGVSASYDGDTSDLLSIMIDSDIFKERRDKMIDEFIGIFMAGMKTTQATTTNLIQYLIKNPDLKDRLMSEICPVLDQIKDDFRGKLTWDNIDGFELTRNCFYESLCIAPPAPMSGTLCFLRDVEIKGI